MTSRLIAIVCITLFCVPASLANPAVGGDKKDIAAYVGGAGDQAFFGVHRLSDGTILVAGMAGDFAWLPGSTKRIELKAEGINASDDKSTPMLLHLTADLKSIKHVLTLPAGAADNVQHIKTTNLPGKPTGDLYISGLCKDGYYIAKLDGNFVDKTPTRLQWAFAVDASRNVRNDQPWDVGGDGKVVFTRGNSYGYDWASVNRLDANGELDVVPDWRTHWGKKPNGDSFEHAGDISKAPGKVTHSGIVLKIWGRGDFRSWNKADFLAKSSDGNGGVKQGKWPFDAFFNGYYDPETKKTAKVLDGKRGYYGYRWGATPCAYASAITIDRRTNDIYIGGNHQSRLPDGNPDFEPFLVAMSKSGTLRWWQRLYSEAKGVSTPDQYVDAIAIDYRKPADEGGSLVVLARAHGNNVNNFWRGDEIKHKDNPGRGFQNGFTGTNGNIHFSWIGRMTTNEGTMLNATYFAEYAEGAKHQDKSFADPLLKHWPHFNAGWPDVNTTRAEPHSLHVDDQGNIYVIAKGRRVITTSNAFMQMPSPTQHKGSRGNWSDFVRVYTPDLTTLHYSSLLAGQWDWQTAKGGSEVDLVGVVPTPQGVVITGSARPDKKTGKVEGNDMPTRNVPDWANKSRKDAMGVVALLHFDR